MFNSPTSRMIVCSLVFFVVLTVAMIAVDAGGDP